MTVIETKTQEQRREESINKMIQAAIDLITEKGVVSLTMAEVGIRAGYSRGLAHQHFKNKEKLLSDCMSYLADQFNIRRKKRYPNAKGLKAIYSLVDSYLMRPKGTIKNSRALMLIILESSSPQSALYEMVSNYNYKNREYIEIKIKEAKKMKEIREDVDEKVVSVILTSLLRGFSVHMIHDDFRNGDEILKEVDKLINSWLV